MKVQIGIISCLCAALTLANQSWAIQQNGDPFLVSDAIHDSKSPYATLLREIAPRVLRTAAASGTVVGVAAGGGGVLYSAFHIFMDGKSQQVHDPRTGAMSIRFDESIVQSPQNGSYPVMIRPEAATGQGLAHPGRVIYFPTVEVPYDPVMGPDKQQIRPESDFFVATVGAGLIELGPGYSRIPAREELLQSFRESWTLPIDKVTTTMNMTMRAPVAGETVLLVGYPISNLRKLSFAVATVSSAKQAISLVQAASKIPLDPKVEFVVDAGVGAGFSGGGAFGLDGAFLGVISRGYLPPEDIRNPGYTRVISANFINRKIVGAAGKPNGRNFEVYLGRDFVNHISSY